MIAPENGFYYHYKHEPGGSIYNYAYEVLGVGHHTEAEGVHFVIYRPLYDDAFVYKNGKMFDVRPLEMFLEEVEKGGRRFPRFTQITDPALIEKLTLIRDQMYD